MGGIPALPCGACMACVWALLLLLLLPCHPLPPHHTPQPLRCCAAMAPSIAPWSWRRLQWALLTHPTSSTF